MPPGCERTLYARPVIPRPRRGRGNPFSFDGATDCHVGPVALLAMTDHSVAGVGLCNSVGRDHWARRPQGRDPGAPWLLRAVNTKQGGHARSVPYFIIQ